MSRGRFPYLRSGTELAALAAADLLAQGSLEEAERYLGLAERGTGSVPDARRGQFQLLLGVVRLLFARLRGDPPAAAEQARRLRPSRRAGCGRAGAAAAGDDGGSGRAV